MDTQQLAPMIDPRRSCLVVVDAQVDFIAPDGAAAQGGLDLSFIPPALVRTNQLIAAARVAGTPIAFARVVTRESTDSKALKLLTQRKGISLESIAICRAGTRGADYHGVQPRSGDLEVQKTLFSSFAGTDFEARLRARGIDTLVVCGFTTECCVDCTVRDAYHRDFNIFVVGDACASYAIELHEGTLRALGENFALLQEADAVIGAWQGLQQA